MPLSKFSVELKEQILSEIKDVGNVTLVAKKHNISSKTIHNWIKLVKNKDQINHSKDIRSLNKKLKDAELEILVLKELLKKTYQRWENAESL